MYVQLFYVIGCDLYWEKNKNYLNLITHSHNPTIKKQFYLNSNKIKRGNKAKTTLIIGDSFISP